MRVINIRISDLSERQLLFGHMGENEHTQIQFNCASVFAQYPQSTVALTVKPPQGDTYPGIITTEGVIVYWTITASDLIYSGSGNYQLTFSENGTIVRTEIGTYTVSESLEPDGEVPTPIENWMEEAQEALNEIEGFNNITASATLLPPGSDPTAEITVVSGHKNIALGIPNSSMIEQTVSGRTPAIVGVDNHRYLCGEVDEISITPPQSGIIDVVFDSGSIPAILTLPSSVKMPVWFDRTSLDADTTYEINILDGVYGVVAIWQ